MESASGLGQEGNAVTAAGEVIAPPVQVLPAVIGQSGLREEALRAELLRLLRRKLQIALLFLTIEACILSRENP